MEIDIDIDDIITSCSKREKKDLYRRKGVRHLCALIPTAKIDQEREESLSRAIGEVHFSTVENYTYRLSRNTLVSGREVYFCKH